MMLVKPRTARQQLAAREVPMSEHVPYTALLDDYTLKTASGSILQVLRLGGFAFETEDQSAINHKAIIRNQLLKGMCSSEFALYDHTIRRRCTVLPEGDFPPGFARDLDEAWKAQLAKKRQFTNETYRTLVRKPPAIVMRANWLANLSGKKDAAEYRSYETRARERLDDAMARIMRTLAPYGPERLGVVERDGAHYSEILEFLGFLLNCKPGPYILPERRSVASILPRVRATFRGDAIELRGPAETRYAAIISLKEYCKETVPGLADRLLSLPHEFIVTQSFRFIDRAKALDDMELKQRQMDKAGDHAISQADEITAALDELQSGEASGLHHFTVMTWAGSTAQLREQVAAIDAELTNIGIGVVRESLNAEACYFGQLPGNFDYLPRAAQVSGENFASFASLHSFPQGKAQGNHWGPAVTVLETTSGTPYHFNFHRADRGHTLVFGRTGSGKTTLVNFLVGQRLKFGGRHVHFDKDRGAEPFIRAVGGTYGTIRDGVPTGINPLRYRYTPEHRAVLGRLFGLMLKPEGADEVNLIAEAVRACYEVLAASERSLSALARCGIFGIPRGNNLAARFELWHGRGALAWAFDNEENTLSMDAPIVGLDMTTLLKSPARSAILYWLWHQIKERLDGTPTSIAMEECWQLLDDDIFVAEIKDLEFAGRKKEVAVIGITQSPDSVVESKIAPALIGQTETVICLANRDAQPHVYCDRLGFSRKQLKIIAEMDERARTFLVRHGPHVVVGKLDLSGMDDEIAILSGTEKSVRLLDSIRAEIGDNPAVWRSVFTSRVASLR